MRNAFGEIIGNSQMKDILSKDIQTSSVSHAYIFEGAEGSGKHTFARLFAAALSCKRKGDKFSDLPCGECPSCQKILSGKSPDVITIGREGKSSIGVDTIRFITSDISVYPNDTDTKVYIIEDAHTMTAQAQNALLLTLEEPPEYAVIVLLCENSRMLLETVRSRAQIFRTQMLDESEIIGYLTSHSPEASNLARTNPANLKEIVNAANGSIGGAMSLLDPKRSEQLLNARKDAVSFIRAASNKNPIEVFTEIFLFGTKREEVTSKLQMLCPALRDLILLKKCENAPLCFFADRDSALELADGLNTSALVKLYDSVFDALDKISQRNANIRLALCNMALNAQII